MWLFADRRLRLYAKVFAVLIVLVGAWLYLLGPERLGNIITLALTEFNLASPDVFPTEPILRINTEQHGISQGWIEPK